MPHRFIDPSGSAVIYARISDEERARRSYTSTQSQLDQLNKWARETGRVIKWERWDEGYTALTFKRPELQRILNEDAYDPQIKYVLVTEIGRFGGRVGFLEVLDELDRKHGIRLLAKDEEVDLRSAAGELSVTARLMVKRFLIRQTAEKIAAKNRMRAERGLWHGGAVPWGFGIDSAINNLVPRLEDQIIPGLRFPDLLKMMHEEFMRTESDTAVADFLNRMRVPAPGDRPAWNFRMVQRILMRPHYAGLIPCNGELFAAAFPAMINRGLYEGSMARRNVRPPARKMFFRTERTYLLAGLASCDHDGCHASLTPYWNFKQKGKRRKQRHYYMCSRKLRAYHVIDHDNRVRADKLEAWVIRELEFLSRSQDLIDRALTVWTESRDRALAPLRDQLRSHEHAVRQCEDQRQNTLRAIASGEMHGPLLAAANEQFSTLEKEREHHQEQVKALRQKLAADAFDRFNPESFTSTLRSWCNLLPRMSDQQLRDLMRECVKQVHYDAEKGYRLEIYAELQGVRNTVLTGVPAGRNFTPVVIAQYLPDSSLISLRLAA